MHAIIHEFSAVSLARMCVCAYDCPRMHAYARVPTHLISHDVYIHARAISRSAIASVCHPSLPYTARRCAAHRAPRAQVPARPGSCYPVTCCMNSSVSRGGFLRCRYFAIGATYFSPVSARGGARARRMGCGARVSHAGGCAAFGSPSGGARGAASGSGPRVPPWEDPAWGRAGRELVPGRPLRRAAPYPRARCVLPMEF